MGVQARVTTLWCPQVVLVLGAEKQGIPVEVIQELDIVVEIPQFGIIRCDEC